MIVSRIQLKNWRNFQHADVELGERVFIVGPNASGKSNFLDALRFLRDLIKPGGGLQWAVQEARGGLSKIRCLAARSDPSVEVCVHLGDPGEPPIWTYRLAIRQSKTTGQAVHVLREEVLRAGQQILTRPDKSDSQDPIRLTQTAIEQINTNANFREVADFLESIEYYHVVPQLIRHQREYTGPGVPGDPYGRALLYRIGQTPERTRRKLLKRIERALRLAVPQLRELRYVIDKHQGMPHLEAVYTHWRPRGAKQQEGDFSDGTLRLIGLLWSLLESRSPLLLEEPELSLHASIVRKLPALIHKLSSSAGRQVIVSTHSAELLSDQGIAPEEVVMLVPDQEGTQTRLASGDDDVRRLLDENLTIAEAVLPRTESEAIHQLLIAWPE